MYYKFKKGKQRALLERAIEKAGSERKLVAKTKIPKGSIYGLKHEKKNLSEKYALALCKFLNIQTNKIGYDEILPSNWGQIKGGKNLIRKKKDDGTFSQTVERLRQVSSKRMKQWHKEMKDMKSTSLLKERLIFLILLLVMLSLKSRNGNILIQKKLNT